MRCTASSGVQSKAIELTRLTQVAKDAKLCMAWGVTKENELTRSTLVAQDAEHYMAWGEIELTRLTLVAQDAGHCMAWGAIEGNRTHPFDSGSAGGLALHRRGCNRRQLNSHD